jgi:hypothetical protein
MYDIWAVYDDEAEPWLLGQTRKGFTCPFDGVPEPDDKEEAIKEAISYAMYRLIRHRFQNSPGVVPIYLSIGAMMDDLGYDPGFLLQNYESGNPAALGNYVAQCIIDFGLQDGSNEGEDYENRVYEPVNEPLVVDFDGNPGMNDPNRWQPLTLEVFIDQAGNPIPQNTPDFLSPEWGEVVPFSLQSEDLTLYERDGYTYWVYHDPGPPPYLDTTNTGGLSEEYKWGFALVSVWAAHLDTADGVMWDISPASIGNIDSFPDSFEDYDQFYDLFGGGDPSQGWVLNPSTGLPYEPQLVHRGDYARVLAEFWADGPDSEPPPGHWFTILNYVNDHPQHVKRFKGTGPILDDLEWDVKAYLTLGGAMHDVAISAWGVKGWYDYVRPISAIRYMADKGQSSDTTLPSFHPAGIPLIPGYIELIEAGDPLAGNNDQHVGKIKLYTWRGPDFIDDPETDQAGVGWIRAENWWPYQRPSFVTPPFAGYVSGHSTYSRAAAEVLTAFTGSRYFPGGMGEFNADKNEFLVFEEGPSDDIILQWATYRDASDQCSLSRIWGGIHPPADDIPGRKMGIAIGTDAFAYAQELFYRDEDNDGFYSFEDCDDTNELVNPDMQETCNGIDDDCSGSIDDDLPTFTWYLDADGDGFGLESVSLDTCLETAPAGFTLVSGDCNDQDSLVNPMSTEICNGLDDDCDGIADDSLIIYTWYLDADGDGFGLDQAFIDTCREIPPVGYALDPGDCNDQDTTINPAMEESCNGLDDNCDGEIDEGLPQFTWFVDADMDGFGDETLMIDTCADQLPFGYSMISGDCDDTDELINPDADDIPNNGIDENCDGLDSVTSVNNPAWAIGINIYPNPTRDFINLEIKDLNLTDLNIEFWDLNGRMLQRIIMASPRIDISEFDPGVYFLKISSTGNSGDAVYRVVKL